MSEQPILEVINISKHYTGVQALRGVSLSVQRGEVRALLGKNGAGKSTLIKILSGAAEPDAGEIRIEGRPVRMSNPAGAFAVGIGTVYQEMSLVPGLTVGDNILLGRWPVRGGMIDQRTLLRSATEALDMMGASVNAKTLVSDLSVPQRQIVEIAKALSFKPKVLVLDEPTSALPQSEVDHLLQLIRRLAENGVAIIYVSHRLQEIPQIADSISVLREGSLVGTIPIAESSPEIIARLMIGEGWNKTYASETPPERGKVLLSVRNLSVKGYLRDVSLDLHAGEVLGIAGLLGSGRTELLHAIMGLQPTEGGVIQVDGETIAHPTPRLMRSKGVGLTPEDRKLKGLVLPLSVEDNLTMSSTERFSRAQVISPGKRRRLAQEMVDALSIVTAGFHTPVGSLSGGNQQKVVIGKWLNAQVRVLLMDEPTRGIDIQAKDQVYALARQLASQGVGIIFVSSELEEVLEVSDRILVFNQGRVHAEMLGRDAELKNVLALAMAKG